ncbi:MAG TPA: tetratricopeptide repeat protein [Vicinamibacterales bacterium]|nr:tetratricopeptide repeat protein [Vicinamibacterales bacterium]
MHPLIRAAIIVAMSVALLSTHAAAQGWKGMGRVAGKVTDESGQTIEGVVVKAYLPAEQGGTEVKSNKSGDWALSGISRGQWQLDFEKDGYESRQVTVAVSELARLPPLTIVLKKAAPVEDANAEIRQALLKGAELMNARQFADARVIYEAILTKYPEAWQIHPLVARTYYGENAFDKAIEQLRLGLEKDPGNVEITLLLGNILVERGDAEEGKRLIDSIDEAVVKDPYVFVNVGIAMLNQQKPTEALSFFAKAIVRFPEHPDAYYYRGLTHLQLEKTAEAKTDLTKFVQLAPAAPEADTARKILEQLK